MKAGEMVYKAQLKYAAWVFRMVARNIGCDFEGMVTLLKEQLKDEKWD